MSVTHNTRNARRDEIVAEMDRRGDVIEQLEARLAHIDGIYKGAIDNLTHNQRQLDADGAEVGVSRQALTEVLTALSSAGETGWNYDLSAAPEGESVILATTGGHVGEAIAPVRSDPDDDWFWAGAGGFIHPNHKPIAWQPMPAGLPDGAAPQVQS